MSDPWPFKEQRHRCYETARSGGLLTANGTVTCRRQASKTHPLHMACRTLGCESVPVYRKDGGD